MMQAKLTYAGNTERLFAFLIDRLILIVPIGITYGLFNGNGISLLAGFLCQVAYYVGFTASGWQATPGKRLMGLYVIHGDGKPITQRDALERFLAFFVPSMPVYSSFINQELGGMIMVALCTAWFAPILILPNRMGLHDRICNTRVIVGRLA